MAADIGTIAELSRALRDRRVTALAVTEQCLGAIAERDGAINAFIRVLGDEARAQARQADEEMASGHVRGPLHGVPISIKDLFDVAGTPTTAASRVREGHVAAADAPLIARLRDAGAVIIGKTNLHEFALGTTNEDSAFGPVRHPRDPSRSAGGSSGGSAASVLAGMAFASLGTDTGGSIRIPSAACGLVGLKPAFGALDMTGVVPLSTTLDHPGPMCRSVEDARLLYDVLVRRDRSEAPDLHQHPSAAPGRALRVGLLRGYFTALLDPKVASTFASAVQRLEDAGIELKDVTVPHAADISAIYTHIALPEASAYHARTLDTRADAYTPNVRLRLELGRYILAEDYVRALRGRDLLKREVDAALEGCDALLLPALAVPATRLGFETVRIGASEEPVRNITLRLTQLFNITGHPAITVPCGKTLDGLPVGAQLVGPAGDTAALLNVAVVLEPYLGPGVSR